MTVIQRTPNLGIGIRLQRVAPSPAPSPAPGGCGCEATGVAWLVQPQYTRDQWGAWWGWPDMRAYEITGLDEYGGAMFDWDTPMGPDFVAVRVPVLTAEWGEPPVTLVAIATGPQTRGVEWTVGRSGSTFQIDIDAQSHVVITLHPFETDGGATAAFENITLTARCGDTVVGTLRLQVYVEGW